MTARTARRPATRREFTPEQRERRAQRYAERVIARMDTGGAFGTLAATAERIRRDNAAGIPWEPFKARAA